MLKKNYKAHVTANRFDLNTLAICGAKTRSGGLCKHKGMFVMVDVNAMEEPLQGQRFKSMGRTIIGMCMALELKKLLRSAN